MSDNELCTECVTGAVFRVKDGRDHEYALKQLPEKRENIIQSFKEMFRSNHENCVSFPFSFFQQHKDSTDGHSFIVMDLCSKKTLATWIAENKTFETRPLLDMKFWIMQLLGALEWLHFKNVIHRDLKPDNIFFANDGEYKLRGSLKIGDFGMIQRCWNTDFVQSDVNEEGSSGLRFPHESYGSEHYGAPELLSKSEYNSKADVFSLGIIAAELLHPFKNMNDEKGVNAALRKKGKQRMVPKLKTFKALLEGDEFVKDFLMTATNPDVIHRPFAKDLVEHALFDDVPKNSEIPLHLARDAFTALMDEFEQVEPPTDEDLIRCDALEEASPQLFHQEHGKTRLGMSTTGLLKANKMRVDDANALKMKIRTVQEIMTSCSHGNLEGTDESLSEYLNDLSYYGSRLQDQQLVAFGLETTSFEKLKASYASGHVRMIPGYEVWSTPGCPEWMRALLGETGKIRFANDNAVFRWIPRDRDCEYDASTEDEEKELEEKLEEAKDGNNHRDMFKKQLSIIIETSIPDETNHLAMRIETMLEILEAGSVEINYTKNDMKTVKSYHRLLLGVCRFAIEQMETVQSMSFSLCTNLKGIALAPTMTTSIVIPTLELFVTEQMEHWESWMEAVWTEWSPGSSNTRSREEQADDSENDDQPNQTEVNENMSHSEVVARLMDAFGIKNVVHM